MNQFAQAGGTKKAIFIGTGASADQDLIAALNAIRGQALACDFPMPQPTDPSMSIDPTTCDLVKSDPAALLEILLGCRTCGGLDASCGGTPPPSDVPPLLF